MKSDTTDNYVEISLGGVLGAGKFAKVSPEDYPMISQYSWHINHKGYAITKVNARHTAKQRLIT
jgi:hypothetical protein